MDIACGCPIFPAPLAEETVLSFLNGLGTLVEKSVDRGHEGLFVPSPFSFIGPYVCLYTSPTVFCFVELCSRFYNWEA